jgi:hypothetical protein
VSSLPFQLPVLALTGVVAGLAAMKLFRWDLGQRFATLRGKGWLALILAGWLATGSLVEWRDRAAAAVAPPVVAADPREPWKNLTSKDIAALDFRGPNDDGVVAPFASEDEVPDADTEVVLRTVRDALPGWAPGAHGADLQRVRNLLCVAAIADITQQSSERFLPAVVLAHLQAVFRKDQLVQMLAWIALHPDEGTILRDVSELGVEGVAGGPKLVRERSYYYAIKFIARLTGRQAPTPKAIRGPPVAPP